MYKTKDVCALKVNNLEQIIRTIRTNNLKKRAKEDIKLLRVKLNKPPKIKVNILPCSDRKSVKYCERDHLYYLKIHEILNMRVKCNSERIGIFVVHNDSEHWSTTIRNEDDPSDYVYIT